MPNLFIQNLFSENPADRFYFFAVVLTVVISIVLHELAHGWMALRCGDSTPRVQGRMTGNPLVHMGPWSLVALAIAGIAWGQMPVDPTRLRGKYAEAKVAAAGPAMNLLIALVALTLLVVLMRVWGLQDMPAAVALLGSQLVEEVGISPLQANALNLLVIAGITNLLLMMFNLLPIPPLDGSHILANFSRRYAVFVSDPKNHGVVMMGFIFAFAVASGPMGGWSITLMHLYTTLLAGVMG